MACFSAVIPAISGGGVIVRRNFEGSKGRFSHSVSVGHFSGFGCGGIPWKQGINRELTRFWVVFGEFNAVYRPDFKDLEVISLFEINREFFRA